MCGTLTGMDLALLDHRLDAAREPRFRSRQVWEWAARGAGSYGVSAWHAPLLAAFVASQLACLYACLLPAVWLNALRTRGSVRRDTAA